jgi:molecular chaperone DnaK
LKEFGDKIPGDKKAPIETALAKLKEAHKSQDIDQIDPAVTELNTAWTAASEDMYKATQGAGQQPGGDGNGFQDGQQQQQQQSGGSENVTDAEFEEVK